MGNEKFNQFLRRKRREKGLSQEDLADDAGISANYLAKLETGKREPGIKVLYRLAESLDIPTDEMFSILIGTWPPLNARDTKLEFSEFKPTVQKLLIEIGHILEKNF